MSIFLLVLLRRVEMVLIALVRGQITHSKYGRRLSASIGVITTLGQLKRKRVVRLETGQQTAR